MKNTNGNVNNGPEKRFKAGAVTATVWANERRVNGKVVTIKSVSLVRNYQDKDGEWKSTNSYEAKGLQDLRLVAQKAYEYLVSKDNDDSVVEEEVEVGLSPARGASAPCHHGEVQLAYEGVKLETRGGGTRV